MGEFSPRDLTPVYIDHTNPAMPFVTSGDITYRNAIVTLTIPKGFRCDFASVPRCLWWLYPPVGLYTRAALVHDYLYRTAKTTRVTADAMFLSLMTADRVPAWQRWPMYAAVRVFGKYEWRKLRRQFAADNIESNVCMRVHSGDEQTEDYA